MTVAAFFGCALTAYGHTLAMFTLTIAKDPVRVIILILRFVQEDQHLDLCTLTLITFLDIFLPFQRIFLAPVPALVIAAVVRDCTVERKVGLRPRIFSLVSRTVQILHIQPAVQGRRLPQKVDRK